MLGGRGGTAILEYNDCQVMVRVGVLLLLLCRYVYVLSLKVSEIQRERKLGEGGLVL